MFLSVITINYNNCDGLKKTAQSVIEQSWQDFEWIVIDGGSTDGSQDVIREYADRITYWCSEPDNGIYHAMNKGIRQATGKFLNFMNSGDAFNNPNVLRDVFSTTAIKDADVIYGNYVDVFPDGKVRPMFTKPDMDLCDLVYCPINHQSTLIRRELLLDGYDETYRLLADWKAFLSWMVERKRFVHTDVTIADFQMDGRHASQESTKQAEIQRLRQEVMPSWMRSMCGELHQCRETRQKYSSIGEVVRLFEHSDILRKFITCQVKVLNRIEKLRH